MGEVMGEQTAGGFDMVLGRRTYDIMAAHWPDAPEEDGAAMFNEATKYVASRGHPDLLWANSVLLEGDVAEAVAALKREGPPLHVNGSGNLTQTLLRHGLIDRFHLWVFPVVIGSGKRLFADGTVPAGLRLVVSEVSTDGRGHGHLRTCRRARYGVVRPGVTVTPACRRRPSASTACRTRARSCMRTLDSFYASVEQRDDPRLRGRPVIVGGGVVLAANYEAKAFGVRTRDGRRAGRRLCPHAIVVQPRMDGLLRGEHGDVRGVPTTPRPSSRGSRSTRRSSTSAGSGGSPGRRPRSRRG